MLHFFVLFCILINDPLIMSHVRILFVYYWNYKLLINKAIHLSWDWSDT